MSTAFLLQKKIYFNHRPCSQSSTGKLATDCCKRGWFPQSIESVLLLTRNSDIWWSLKAYWGPHLIQKSQNLLSFQNWFSSSQNIPTFCTLFSFLRFPTQPSPNHFQKQELSFSGSNVQYFYHSCCTWISWVFNVLQNWDLNLEYFLCLAIAKTGALQVLFEPWGLETASVEPQISSQSGLPWMKTRFWKSSVQSKERMFRAKFFDDLVLRMISAISVGLVPPVQRWWYLISTLKWGIVPLGTDEHWKPQFATERPISDLAFRSVLGLRSYIAAFDFSCGPFDQEMDSQCQYATC